MRAELSFLLLLLHCVTYLNASCPSYESIRTSAMSASRFSNELFARHPLYVAATNEPAVPNMTVLHCPCNVYEISLPGRKALGPDSYTMHYTSACGDKILGFHNLSIPLEGYWNATDSPGLHYENYYHARRHLPTMIFNATYDPIDGSITYASGRHATT